MKNLMLNLGYKNVKIDVGDRKDKYLYHNQLEIIKVKY
jgi:hypothetical protein